MDKDTKLAYAIIGFFTSIFLITEVLSVFRILTSMVVLILWVFFGVLFVIYCVKKKAHFRLLFRDFWSEQEKMNQVLLIILICFGVCTFFISAFTVVNNGDSMAYHLVRVQHWAQERSVDYFYSNDIRQVVFPILSEYVLLHVYLITGSDTFFNLLQWMSYIVCAYYIYKISLKFHVSKSFSLIASLLFMSMPLSIAEATTTQVDLFGTMWVCLFSYLVLDFICVNELSISPQIILKTCFISMAIGLTYLTKSNACIVPLLFCIWLLIECIRRRDKAITLFWIVLTAGIVLIFIMLPSMIRNYLYSGTLLAAGSFGSICIGTLQPKYLLVNVYKNISMEFFQPFIIQLDDVLLMMGRLLAEGLSVDINNPLISLNGNDYFNTASSMYYYFHSDYAGNPLLFSLGIISLPLCLVHFVKERRNEERKYIYAFMIVVWIGFFISTIVIRWQPWITRLLLPSSALICVIVTYTLWKLAYKAGMQEFVIGIIVCAMLVGSINSLTYNVRPALKNIFGTESKTELYYYYYPDLYSPYAKVSDYIIQHDYSTVGLEEVDYEYAIWTMLRPVGINIEHVSLQSDSENATYIPDCIITKSSIYKKDDMIEYGHNSYVFVPIFNLEDEMLGIFVRK